MYIEILVMECPKCYTDCAYRAEDIISADSFICKHCKKTIKLSEHDKERLRKMNYLAKSCDI